MLPLLSGGGGLERSLFMKNKATIATFVGVNAGHLKNCYANVKSKQKGITFCKQNTGAMDHAFEVKEIIPIEQQTSEKLTSHSSAQSKLISIQTKEQLMEIQQKINAGDTTFRHGHFQLCNDIDLKGIKWIPIGSTDTNSFQGTFDGNGYTIHNLTVHTTTKSPCGFFGTLHNASVCNLTIHGNAYGGNATGLLCGCSLESHIASCIVKGKVKGKLCAGIMLGKNTGQVEQCYGEGTVTTTPVVGIVARSVASVALIVTAAFMLSKKMPESPKYYPPIPIDTEVIRLDNKEPKSGKSSIACGFDTECFADKKGNASIHFRNPGESNQHVVVSIQIPDKELVDKIGKTGRTKKEMKELETSDSYDPNSYRVEVGRSGTIPPGYELKTIKLSSLPDGSKLPKGTYNAVVYLTFYDIHSNQQAMVHTQSSVSLVVK